MVKIGCDGWVAWAKMSVGKGREHMLSNILLVVDERCGLWVFMGGSDGRFEEFSALHRWYVAAVYEQLLPTASPELQSSLILSIEGFSRQVQEIGQIRGTISEKLRLMSSEKLSQSWHTSTARLDSFPIYFR